MQRRKFHKCSRLLNKTVVENQTPLRQRRGSELDNIVVYHIRMRIGRWGCRRCTHSCLDLGLAALCQMGECGGFMGEEARADSAASFSLWI